MNTVFVDTVYLVALLNPRDEFHKAAVAAASAFNGRMVTTAWVIAEVASQLSRPPNRAAFLALLRDLQSDDRVDIIPPDRGHYDRGLRLYAERSDKEWSLIDCISFVVMDENGLGEALTADHHFEQAGYSALMR